MRAWRLSPRLLWVRACHGRRAHSAAICIHAALHDPRQMDHDYSFSGDLNRHSRLYEAWRAAMDIRKFEIELYWRRAAYFWTFIGLTLAGYGAVLTARKTSLTAAEKSDALFAVACVGVVFSLAWYFVNRGSKFWQRNWEYQVSLLEAQVIGPLYSTVFAKHGEKFFSDPTGAYPFSVSSINHVLSLFVTSLFLYLAAYSLPCVGLAGGCVPSWPKVVIAAIAGVFCVLLFLLGRTATMRKAGAFDPAAVSESPVTVSFATRRVRPMR